MILCQFWLTAVEYHLTVKKKLLFQTTVPNKRFVFVLSKPSKLIKFIITMTAFFFSCSWGKSNSINAPVCKRSALGRSS